MHLRMQTISSWITVSLYNDDVELNKERNRYGKVQVAGDVGCSSYRQA